MLYEIGGFFSLTDEVRAGLIATDAQKKACGYVNDPDDAGGETKYGIAKNSHPTLDIAGLTWDDALGIYYNEYWLGGQCDKFTNRIALLHFDGCINHGISRANKFLQKAAGVSDDGQIGAQTLAAVANVDELQMCKNICDQRIQFYKDIVAKKPSQVKYLNGWLRRINEMRVFTTDPNGDF